MALPLRVGDHGAEVADLRRRLVGWLAGHTGDEGTSLGGSAEDEVFDASTADAVRRFQRSRNLPADAVVGPETWTALVEATWALGDRLLWHSTTTMRGDDVQDLQQRLNQLGFLAGPEDGLFGPATRDAVREFQTNVGLEVDGVVGAGTIAMLHRLHRGHHSPGVRARVGEEDELRRLARAGLTGLQVAVDPSDVVVDHPQTAPLVPGAATIPWQLASRVAGRLSARGARPLWTRGPQAAADRSARARTINALGADLVVVLTLNTDVGDVASGAAAYHYGSLRFVSSAGQALADAVLDATIAAGLGPDCRTHPMTWTLLRETRMPAVVLEPGFATNPEDVARLSRSDVQDRLAGSLVDGLAAFLRRRAA